MSNTFKKFMAALTSLFMALALVPANAFGATIDISNASAGETYSAYKLLNYTTDGNDHYSYYLTTDEYNAKSGSETQSYGQALTAAGFQFTASADGTQYVLTNADKITNDNIQDVINKLAPVNANGGARVVDSVVAAHALQTATATGTAAQDGSVSASFTDANGDAVNFSTGYYLITSTTGSLVTLKRADDTATVFDKNEVPSVDKKVTGGSASTAADSNTASVGDVLTYTVDISAKKGATNYVFNDTLSAGLTLGAKTDLSVKVGNTALTEGTDYTVSTFTANTDGDGSTPNIKITFAKSYLDSLTTNTTVTVSYKATVNSDALTVDKVNNKANMNYGQNSTTNTDEVDTKLFGFGLKKVDGTNKTTALKDVQFTLTKTVEGTTYYYAGVDSQGNGVWTTTAPTAGNDGTYTGAVLTTGEEGRIQVNGIAEGDYVLTEVKTNAGYNLLSQPVNVTIDKDGNLTATGAVTVNADAKVVATNSTTITVDAMTVENNKGSELPSTGGMGTVAFTVVGAALVIGAGVALVTRRRMQQ